MVSKTRRMVTVEKKFRQPLDQLILALINEEGFSQTEVAQKFGVSKAGLGYWLLKFGITVRTVALGPGDTLEIKSPLPHH